MTPVSTAPFLPASQFTVCTSRFARPRDHNLLQFRAPAPTKLDSIGNRRFQGAVRVLFCAWLSDPLSSKRINRARNQSKPYSESQPIQTVPFTPKFLQINSLPVLGGNFFCNFYGNSLRPPICSVTPMRSSGSRVDWKIFFVIFTKLIPRKIFFCIANILVLMVLGNNHNRTRSILGRRYISFPPQ